MTIGENIKKKRKEKGLTQKQLAEYAGLSNGAIQQYELNLRNPKTEQLKKIADVFGCTIDSLTHSDDEINTQFYLEKIYSQLGYVIHYDDPEHKPFLIHGKESARTTRKDLEIAQDKILTFIRFVLDDIIQDGDK